MAASCTLSSSSHTSFGHECEDFQDFEEGVDCRMKFNLCMKNPGHSNFLSVCDLKIDDVPPAFQTDEGMRFMKDRCNRTVKLQLSYTSTHRPDTWYGTDKKYPYRDFKGSNHTERFGTGFIINTSMYTNCPCPCKECKESGRPFTNYVKVGVSTARHLVYDDFEAVKTVSECFYDTPDRRGVNVLYGLDINVPDVYGFNSDFVVLNCVSHDIYLMDRLNSMMKSPDSRLMVDSTTLLSAGFIVSHPHGVHKHISFGSSHFHLLNHEYPKRSEAVKCRLKHLPNTHNAPISQFLEKETIDKVIKVNKEVLTHSSVIEPGIEYLLPETSRIFTPHCDVDPSLGVIDDRDGWFQLPEGSGYCLDGQLAYFPQGMEIHGGNIKSLKDELKKCPDSYEAAVYSNGRLYQGYDHIHPPGRSYPLDGQDEDMVTKVFDIPTCPGSCGALVVVAGLDYPHFKGTDQFGSSYSKKWFQQETHVTKECDMWSPSRFECEVLFVGEENPALRLDGWKKYPGFNHFIPVKDFKMEDLPQEYQTQDDMDFISNACSRTVKMMVYYTSWSRPDSDRDSYMNGSHTTARHGTGYIESGMVEHTMCPCPKCKTSNNPEMSFIKVKVRTSTHVVYEQLEAESTVCELFYDREYREGVNHLYGISCKSQHDRIIVECVTHDPDLIQRIQILLMDECEKSYTNHPRGGLGFIVSHPHGSYKHISVGKLSDMERYEHLDRVGSYFTEEGKFDRLTLLTSATKEPFLYKDNSRHPISTNSTKIDKNTIDGDNVNRRSNVDGNGDDEIYYDDGVLDLRAAVYPCFANRTIRKASFRFWDPNHAQKPDDLVELGFFYGGYSDCARCFNCGLGLKNWRPADDVAYQHARFRPQCQYICFMKGQEFIDQVQREINASNQGVDEGESQVVSNSDSKISEKPNLDRLMSVDAAKKAIQEGWTKQQVQSAVTKLVEDLGEDCLSYDILMDTLINQTNGCERQEQEEADDDLELEGKLHPQVIFRLLERENAYMRKRLHCMVCGTVKIGCVYLPCGHVIACKSCGDLASVCTSCGIVIHAIADIYIS